MPPPLHVGTTILIVLSSLFAAIGGISVLVGIVMTAIGGARSQQVPGTGFVIDGQVTLVLGALILAIGIVGVWLGKQIRRGTNWARVTLTIMLGLAALSALGDLADPDAPARAVVGLGIDVTLIALLWVRSSNDYFRAHGNGPAA